MALPKTSYQRRHRSRVGPSGHQWRKYVFDACLPDDRSQKQAWDIGVRGVRERFVRNAQLQLDDGDLNDVS
jgi:hypothetical protein